jgi:hypothetical protein
MKPDREAVKTLAIAVGVREAARQLNLNENTVISWSKRDNWFPTPQPIILSPKANQNKVATSAIKPSDALANTLNDRKKQSKLGLSKYAADASERAAKSNGDLKIAPRVRDVAAIHQALWPEKEESGSGVMGGLRLYSNQTIVQVQTHEDAREGTLQGEVVSE